MAEAPLLPFVFEEPEGGPDADVSGTVTPGESDRRRLLAGELSDDEFLDLQVSRATSHLQGQVAPERLEALREVLRGELTSDPELCELFAIAKSRDGAQLGA